MREKVDKTKEQGTELIETLWNVNNKKWGGTWVRIKGINRNIVECKLQ